MHISPVCLQGLACVQCPLLILHQRVRGEANCRLEERPRGHTSGHLHENYLAPNSHLSLKSFTQSLTKSCLARVCFLPLVSVPPSAAIKPLRIFGCIFSHSTCFCNRWQWGHAPTHEHISCAAGTTLRKRGYNRCPGSSRRYKRYEFKKLFKVC